MLKAACLIARKDLRLVLSRGAGLVQALLLGLLLIFVFSLSRETGETMSGQGAATIFWLSSAFCQVLSFNMLYGLEEANGSRAGLLLLPTPVQSVLLGKAAAGLCIILTAQFLFLPATIVFLGQSLGDGWPLALLALVLTDIGMASLGSLLGALSQGQAAPFTWPKSTCTERFSRDSMSRKPFFPCDFLSSPGPCLSFLYV